MRATHSVIIGIFGFAAVEKVRGILTILGGPDDGRTIATRHGKRWLLPDGKEAQVKEYRERKESQVGQASRRTWPVIATDYNDSGRDCLLEVLEEWNGTRWTMLHEDMFREAIPERQRQDKCLVYDDAGKPKTWWRAHLGRWWRDQGADAGRWWRDAEREKRAAQRGKARAA